MPSATPSIRACSAGPDHHLRLRSVHAGHGHNTPRNVECSGADEFVRALRGQLAQGVDQIKLMYTGGLEGAYEGTMDIQMTEAEVRACIEVAHNNSKRIAAHLSNDKAIAQAVRLGLDSVEHAYTLSDETCRMMAEKGTFLTPPWWSPTATTTSKSTAPPSGTCASRPPPLRSSTSAAGRQVGVTICTGTDLLPSDPIDGTTPTIRETELLVEDVGMTPLQAIRCATRNGAELCGVLAETGTLEPGKLGDFLTSWRAAPTRTSGTCGTCGSSPRAAGW
ncbi:MAG: amidohydrolase family protein [Dysosmobacter sp.]